MKKTLLASFFFFVSVILLLVFPSYINNEEILGATPALNPTQGGTGIGSVTISDVGKVLTVSSSSPFKYSLETISSSQGLTTTTPWTVNELTQVVDGGTVRSIATSSLGLPTFSTLDSYLTTTTAALTYYPLSNPAGYITSTPAGGSNLQIQVNENGTFAGYAGLTFTSSTGVLFVTTTVSIGTSTNPTLYALDIDMGGRDVRFVGNSIYGNGFITENTLSGQKWALGTAGNSTILGPAGAFYLYDYNGNDLEMVLTNTGLLGLGQVSNPLARIHLPASTATSGGLLFGTDTNLYRSAANVMTTDDSLIVSGSVTTTNVTVTSTLRLSALSDGCLQVSSGLVISSACGGGTSITATQVAFGAPDGSVTSSPNFTFTTSTDQLFATNGRFTTVTTTNLAIEGLTQGSVSFVGANGILSQDNANLYWNDTTNQLGVRTSTFINSSVALEVNGQSEFRNHAMFGRDLNAAGWQNAASIWAFSGSRPFLAKNNTTGKIGILAEGGTQGLQLGTSGRSVLFDGRSIVGTSQFDIASGYGAAHIDGIATYNSSTLKWSAIRYNYLDTASASTSLLLDLQRNNVPQFVVRKDGNVGLGGETNPLAVVHFAASTTAAGGLLFGSDTNLYRSATDTLQTDDSLVIALTATTTNLRVTTGLTLPNNSITNAFLRQSAGLSVIGRSANSTGNVADITAASDNQVLRRSGTTIGFGSLDLSQSNTVGTSILGIANGGTGSSSTKPSEFTRIYTASTTWTKPTSSRFAGIHVYVIGGGGSGGGSGTNSTVGAGGAGAGMAYEFLDTSELSSTSSVAVTIGSGGAAPTAGNNAGSAGGTSSFGTFLTATGGNGGVAASSGESSTTGGTGSGGDFNYVGGRGSQNGSSADSWRGRAGGCGARNTTAPTNFDDDTILGVFSAGGYAGQWCGSGGLRAASWDSGTAAINGGNGNVYGGGGAGGVRNSSNASGGAGAQGAIIIVELYN